MTVRSHRPLTATLPDGSYRPGAGEARVDALPELAAGRMLVVLDGDDRENEGDRGEIAARRRAVIVYLRGQEVRGIGLWAKLRAYTLQDGGWTPSTRTSPRTSPPMTATTSPEHQILL